MRAEALPPDETIEINVDGSPSSFPPSLSLLSSATRICLHVRDVKEVEGDALFRQRCSLATPVAQQVASLAARKLREARVGSRGGACCAEARRPIRLWKCWNREYQGQDDTNKRTSLDRPTLKRAPTNRNLCVVDPRFCF